MMPPGFSRRVALDGLTLHAEVTGEPTPASTPLVLLHGFTGSAAGWRPFIDQLGEETLVSWPVVAIDIVGHGESDAPLDVERYRMARVADDLVGVLRALGCERGVWLGYSMGGRTALQIAVRHPNAVAALILEGASPGIESVEERERRMVSDEALAVRIEQEGVQAFVDYWESIPLFASQASLPAAERARIRSGRLANRASGLARSLRGMGAGAQQPLHDHLAAVTAPVLLLAGALDTTYVAVGHQMAVALPHATMHVVPQAGHAAHIEQPAAVAGLVRAFLHDTLARP